jgi:hypothetical protein
MSAVYFDASVSEGSIGARGGTSFGDIQRPGLGLKIDIESPVRPMFALRGPEPAPSGHRAG